MLMLRVIKIEIIYFLLSISLFHAQCYSVELTEEEFAPLQLTPASCQSYALATALQLIDNTGRYSLEDDEEEELVAKLRIMELTIRNLVQIEMQKRNDTTSNRIDWKNAIESFTNNNYTVKNRNFSNLDMLFNHISKRFNQNPACSSISNKCIFNRPKTSSTTQRTDNITIYLTSVSSVGDYTYSEGHVVGIVDIEKNYLFKPALKVINSWSQTSSNTCTPLRGTVSWLKDYEIKNFNGLDYNFYNLAWIAPVSQ